MQECIPDLLTRPSFHLLTWVTKTKGMGHHPRISPNCLPACPSSLWLACFSSLLLFLLLHMADKDQLSTKTPKCHNQMWRSPTACLSICSHLHLPLNQSWEVRCSESESVRKWDAQSLRVRRWDAYECPTETRIIWGHVQWKSMLLLPIPIGRVYLFVRHHREPQMPSLCVYDNVYICLCLGSRCLSLCFCLSFHLFHSASFLILILNPSTVGICWPLSLSLALSVCLSLFYCLFLCMCSSQFPCLPGSVCFHPLHFHILLFLFLPLLLSVALPLFSVLFLKGSLEHCLLASQHKHEILWVVVDLKRRYRNGQNEWMNEWMKSVTLIRPCQIPNSCSLHPHPITSKFPSVAETDTIIEAASGAEKWCPKSQTLHSCRPSFNMQEERGPVKLSSGHGNYRSPLRWTPTNSSLSGDDSHFAGC